MPSDIKFGIFVACDWMNKSQSARTYLGKEVHCVCSQPKTDIWELQIQKVAVKMCLKSLWLKTATMYVYVSLHQFVQWVWKPYHTVAPLFSVVIVLDIIAVLYYLYLWKVSWRWFHRPFAVRSIVECFETLQPQKSFDCIYPHRARSRFHTIKFFLKSSANNPHLT